MQSTFIGTIAIHQACRQAGKHTAKQVYQNKPPDSIVCAWEKEVLRLSSQAGDSSLTGPGGAQLALCATWPLLIR